MIPRQPQESPPRASPFLRAQCNLAQSSCSDGGLGASETAGGGAHLPGNPFPSLAQVMPSLWPRFPQAFKDADPRAPGQLLVIGGNLFISSFLQKLLEDALGARCYIQEAPRVPPRREVRPTPELSPAQPPPSPLTPTGRTPRDDQSPYGQGPSDFPASVPCLSH